METREKKGRTNGYIAFSGDRRERMKHDGQNLSPTATVQKIAAEWRALSENEKERWKQVAKDM